MSDQGIIPPKDDDQIGEQPKPTLREELAYAVKDATARQTETPEETEARHRDEQGRFAKKEETSQPTTRERTMGTLSLPAGKAGMPVDPAQAQSIKAPETWKAEAKTQFDTLPDWAKAEIARREGDMHKLFTAQDQDRNLGKRVRELSQPYMQVIRAEGGNEDQAYGNFLNWAYVMRGNNVAQKVQALRDVCTQFNVPIEAIASQPSGQQQNPVLQAIQANQTETQQLRQEMQRWLQQRQYQEQAELNGEIEAFQQSPGHDHFDKVKHLMGVLLESGQASDLEDAYDKAVYATPEIRSTLTAQQSQAAQTQRIAQSQAITDAARKAAVSVSGAPGGARPVNGSGEKRSLRDELRAQFAASSGRV